MKYLLDTDHVSVLQQQSGLDYDALSARIALHPPADLALSVVSFHEQVLGCHTYINRARTAADVVRGYGINPARKIIKLVTVLALRHTRCTCARSSWRLAPGASPVSA